MKRKISVTTGTRAEYGILRSVLKTISKSKQLDLYLLVTGMHLSKKYGMTVNEIKKDVRAQLKVEGLKRKDDGYNKRFKELYAEYVHAFDPLVATIELN